MQTRIILVGAGPLGLKVANFILERPNLELAGVVDLNPDLKGKSAADLIEGAPADCQISSTVSEALERSGGAVDAAVVTTVSSIHKIQPTLQTLAECRLPVVTTCEELVYPWIRNPEVAESIDAVFKANGVACLGTGVNPGYLMDYLPVVLTSIHQRVDHVLVERFQDASIRRIPFQKKIGAGLSMEEFEAAKTAGTLRHVGLLESLDMIAAAMGCEVDSSEETLTPVLAAGEIENGYVPIGKNQPAGVEQIATAMKNGREIIRIHFRAAVGEPASFDRIEVKGLPGAIMEIRGGVNGDIATSAITVNAISSILRATPGLRTMLDVPVPGYIGSVAGRV